eukprot:3175201-Pyramimonas_sp.AAC.1
MKEVGRGNSRNHLRPEGWWDFEPPWIRARAAQGIWRSQVHAKLWASAPTYKFDQAGYISPYHALVPPLSPKRPRADPSRPRTDGTNQGGGLAKECEQNIAQDNMLVLVMGSRLMPVLVKGSRLPGIP